MKKEKIVATCICGKCKEEVIEAPSTTGEWEEEIEDMGHHICNCGVYDDGECPRVEAVKNIVRNILATQEAELRKAIAGEERKKAANYLESSCAIAFADMPGYTPSTPKTLEEATKSPPLSNQTINSYDNPKGNN